MATSAPEILRGTDLVLYKESSKGVQSGEAWKLSGLEGVVIRRVPVSRHERRDWNQNLTESRPVLQSYKLEIGGEFDNNGGWEEIMFAIFGDPDSTALATPSSGTNTHTCVLRNQKLIQTFGATVAMEAGEIFKISGMAVESLRLRFVAGAVCKFKLEFVAMGLEGGATAVTPDRTYTHNLRGPEAVNVKLVLGDGATFAGDSTDILKPTASATIHLTQRVQVSQYETALLGVGEGTRIAFKSPMELTGELKAYVGSGDTETLATGSSEGRVAILFREGETDEFSVEIPAGEFFVEELPVARDDWGINQISFVSKTLGSGAADMQICTATLAYPS